MTKIEEPTTTAHRTVVDQLGVTLLVRNGCQCSTTALAVLRDEGVEPRVLDLVAHPEFAEKFGQQTPVVLVDGKRRFFGKVEPVLLRRLLRQRSGGSTSGNEPRS